MADSSWARFDVVFFRREWLEGTTPGMRLAWAELVLHVKGTSPSQKKPNRATSLSARTCSRMWDIPQEEVEALLSLAVHCGELTIDGSSWVVTELDPFISEKTKRRNEADQDESDFADKSDKSGESGQIGQIGHSVYTGQDRTVQDKLPESSPTPPSGGEVKPTPVEEPPPEEAPKRQRRTWPDVCREMAEAMPKHAETLKIWFKYRQGQPGKVWLPETVEANIAEFKTWPVERLSAAVRHSIRNSWSGIFEEKGARALAPPVHEESIQDRSKRIGAEAEALLGRTGGEAHV